MPEYRDHYMLLDGERQRPLGWYESADALADVARVELQLDKSAKLFSVEFVNGRVIGRMDRLHLEGDDVIGVKVRPRANRSSGLRCKHDDVRRFDSWRLECLDCGWFVHSPTRWRELQMWLTPSTAWFRIKAWWRRHRYLPDG